VYKGFRVAAAYLYADQPATLFTGGDGHFIANTTAGAVGAAGPFSYIGHPDHMSIWGAGSTYAFGALTLAGLYTRAIYSDANGTRSDVTYDNYDVSLRYMLTPSVKLFVGNLYTVGHVGYSGQVLKYDRIALGVDYALSKRTEVYGVVVAQQAFGDANYANIYQGALAMQSTTNRQAGGRVGIVTKF
jgi:predicted porin